MTQLNDSLEDLIFAEKGEVRTAPVREGAVAFKSAEQRFEENCPKCRGTGRFVGRNGRIFGQCFSCKGAGKFTFKTSPETRAANRQQDAARKDRVQQDVWQAFAAANQAVAEWIIANRARFDFAAKMNEAVIRYGDLTAGQREAVERCIAREVAKALQREESAQQAPQVDTAGIDRLKLAFDSAVAYAREKGLTMKTPKIVIGGVKIYPAQATGKNPGAIYVKANRGGTYFGKIAGGQFFASRECDEETKAKVLEFVADPAKASVAYGQTTGTCCICNATLISKWKHRGIGPICARKMGWAALAEDFGVDVK
jgi:hypothetical protein